MDVKRFERLSEFAWCLPAREAMRVPGVIYASESLLREMDEKVGEQLSNVAALPGIVTAAYAMPDAHWGYGFPIGGVAAFDAAEGGVVSAGGVGFDISCGVRTLHTGLMAEDVLAVQEALADELFRSIPAGMGSTGAIRLDERETRNMLVAGARWAVERGWGREEDLGHTEEQGCMTGADPDAVSEHARRRQRDEMGTLGSGNHYLEVQQVVEVYDREAAETFGVHPGQVKVSIHCGSRGLGHQIGTEFLPRMAKSAPRYGIQLPDRELACVPIDSPLGQDYLKAMRAGINCALANRQIITDLTRRAFAKLFPNIDMPLLYDVSHNTCKFETHDIGGSTRRLYVHRKGATRALGSGHPELPQAFAAVGQPVLIGGTMGTASYILAGTQESEQRAFGSACHGAGRALSRRQATRQWQGRAVRDELARRGILIRSPSDRGIAEEAPGAYKDVGAVVDSADHAGLARRVARLEPLICIKG